MNELLKVELNENQEPVVSARMLHEYLEVKTRYNDWIERKIEYGFSEHEDFNTITQKRVTAQRNVTEYQDHVLKLDMAKELCMLEKNDKGRQARRYFIQVEKDWNSPDKIMARALKIAGNRIHLLEKKIEEQAPQIIFANAVTASHNSILIGDLAKLIKQNRYDIGAKRLFLWMREHGYLIKRKGADYNSPTQHSMEMLLFEITERAITHSDGHITISKTTKVTGKGQQYFINIFLGEKKVLKEVE